MASTSFPSGQSSYTLPGRLDSLIKSLVARMCALLYGTEPQRNCRSSYSRVAHFPPKSLTSCFGRAAPKNHLFVLGGGEYGNEAKALVPFEASASGGIVKRNEFNDLTFPLLSPRLFACFRAARSARELLPPRKRPRRTHTCVILTRTCPDACIVSTCVCVCAHAQQNFFRISRLIMLFLHWSVETTKRLAPSLDLSHAFVYLVYLVKLPHPANFSVPNNEGIFPK